MKKSVLEPEVVNEGVDGLALKLAKDADAAKSPELWLESRQHRLEVVKTWQRE